MRNVLIWIGVILVAASVGGARVVAQASGGGAPANQGQCRYKTLPPAEQPASTLPYTVCESTKSCREAKADWIEAFDQNEKAQRAFKVAVQTALDAELRKPAVREALLWSSRTPQDLDTEKGDIGTFTDTPATTLATALRAYQGTPDLAGADTAFKAVAGVLAPDLSPNRYLVDEENRLQALRDRLAAHRKEVDASLLTPLGGFVSAVKTAQITDLGKRAKEAQTCLELAKAAAEQAGVDTKTIGQSHSETKPGPRISIRKARFGEFDKGLVCDALPKVRDSCEFTNWLAGC